MNAWVPEPLRVVGPGGLAWWQWIALALLLATAIIAGALLGRLTRAILGRIAAKTAVTWDDAILRRTSGPVTAGWTLGIFAAAAPLLDLAAAQGRVDAIVRSLVFLVFFWALMRGLDVAGEIIVLSSWAKGRPAARALVAIGRRVAKAMIVVIAVIAFLSELGYPVASLVAGLGIGGLALALAAQKTVENLFGAFSIGVDQPFREGDFVKVEDFVATVEAIGLRSTRFRTLDRTVITIPNGRLADMRVESFAARDRIRLALVIGLVYGTTSRGMRAIIAKIEAHLRAHPQIWPDSVVVRFAGLGESSLNVEIMAWFQTSDWSEFQKIREEMLLVFMEIVEDEGSSFAFPTRTLHVVASGLPVRDADEIPVRTAAE